MVAATPRVSAVTVPTAARSVDVIPTERAGVMTALIKVRLVVNANESMAVVTVVALVVAVVVVVVVREVVM
jgi:hypothetical protein